MVFKDSKASWWLGSFVIAVMLIAYNGPVWASMGVRTLGIRALGMGGAYTAVSDDVAAVFWNPAGLMQCREPSVDGALAFHQDAADSYESFVSYLEPDSGYGAGVLSWYYGRLNPKANPDGVQYETTHDFCYSLSKPIGNQVYLGGNIHYRRTKQPFASSTTVSWIGDASALVKISDSVKVGITVRDLYQLTRGHSDKTGTKSANMLVGLAFQPHQQVIIAVDGYDVFNRLGSRSVRFGGEYELKQGLALRAGLQRGLDTPWEAWTLGVGLDLANWRVEYAYLDGDYQGIHTMGITWQF